MNIGGLFGGLVAGAIGSILWACIAYFGNVEIGWIAWGIGAAVGFGVSVGSSEGGPVPAVIAVLITIASLCGGKYIAVQLAMSQFDNQVNQVTMELTDEDCVESIAYDLAKEQANEGEPVQYNNGKNLMTARSFEDYSVDIQEAAQEAWDDKTDDEQKAFRDEIQSEVKEAIKNFKSEFSAAAFFESFSAFDLLFFGLGIFTAGKIAFADYVRN